MNRPVTAGQSPWFSGRLISTAILMAVVLGICAPVLADSDQPLHTFSLLSGVVARVHADGSLSFDTGSGFAPLLTGEIVPLVDTRRSRSRQNSNPFSAVAVEGTPGGQRGFSAHCDDDADGLVDEDPLDGRDNDGDGRIDEDFAAISDAMVVVHQDGRQGGGRAGHLEYYHWAYPHLRTTVFLTATGTPGLSNGGTYRLVLSDQDWAETTIISNRHSLVGKTEPARVSAFVAHEARPGPTQQQATTASCDPGARLWLGVVVLSEAVNSRTVLDNGVLSLGLGETPLPVAICVAESWSQLSHIMNEAVRVHAGVTDKLTGQQAPWIVPPLCAQCRLGKTPTFSWSKTDTGDLQLMAHITPGHSGALDPDLFKLGGQPLGAPREIRWLPAAGPVVTVPWTCMNATLLNRPHDRLSSPYGKMPDLMDHQGAGLLVFTFTRPLAQPRPGEDQISGSYLDGRPLVAPVTAAPVNTPESVVGSEIRAQMSPAEKPAPETGQEVDQAQLLKSADQRPTLSPQLLEGFPNPFREMIQLRFQIPATVGEAFVWDKAKAPPSGLDLRAAVPWQGGTPQVSVKIYSINGQELATLFLGSLGPGESMVRWDGTDNMGRQVASGTYFCKLQMDKWSITRRIVFLR